MTTTSIPELERLLDEAERKSAKLASTRAALPPGSSRARVTSANARWARAAEYRDLLQRQLQEAREARGQGGTP